jgi:methylated-DNA-[protein]-cysteine S-methyltransferase
MGDPTSSLVFETAAGFSGIAWNPAGVTHFHLPVGDHDAAERSLRRRAPTAVPAEATSEIAAVVAAVRRYFGGEAADLSGVPLDLAVDDAFFARVYAAVRRIEWGRTTTYGALARELGAGPEAARDVGQAMARNPVPLLVPCHRVLAAGGRIGGFSAPGGQAAKRRMLALEGVALDPPAARQRSFAF